MEKRNKKPQIQENEPFTPYRGTVVIKPEFDPTKRGSGRQTALDGMSHDDIAAFRIQRVKQYKVLNIFPKKYHPFKRYNRLAWGPVTPGAIWTEPTAYYVYNPYVLIVMVPALWAVGLNHMCKDVSIVYKDGVFTEEHKGLNAQCWFYKIYKSNDYPGKFRPVMVNAWDAGFFYIHVDRSKSINIKRSFKKNHITNCVSTAVSYFHYGAYSANSISPAVPKHWLTLKKRNVETLVHIKLWRNKPKSPTDPADLTYITHVIL